MKFFKFIKDLDDASNKMAEKRKNREEKEKKMQSLTSEQKKDNKKGKKSIIWSVFATIVYVLALGAVISLFQDNVAVGIFAMFIIIPISSVVHRKAIKLAKDQLALNGKRGALIFAYFLPVAVLVVGILFFTLGGFTLFL